MRRIFGFPVLLSLLLPLTLLPACAPAAAQAAEAPAYLKNFKLLAPGVGWAMAGDRLLWTKTGGDEWSDITPAVPQDDSANVTLCSVSFTDRTTGWALLCPAEGGTGPATDFRLALTHDAGATWALQKLALTPRELRHGRLSNGNVSALDAAHGWIEFALAGPGAGGADEHAGLLLGTLDSGKTWNELVSVGAGPVQFINPACGWAIASSEASLFSTCDGAEGWQEVVLPPPGLSATAYHALYYTFPVFTGARLGVLPVLYKPTEETKPGQVALFTTSNGGEEWAPARLVQIDSPSDAPPTAVVQSTFMTGAIANTTLALTSVAASAHSDSGTARADLSEVARATRVNALQFADQRHGWALVSDAGCPAASGGCAQLIATVDGGSTWTNITPPEAHRMVPRKPAAQP